MFMSLKKFTPIMSIAFLTRQHENDVNRLELPSRTVPETGWERVKKMYNLGEGTEISVELHHVSQSSMAAFVIGACMGGFVSSRNAYLHFIETNQATAFKSTVEAKKKLQDYVTIAFAKGAVKWGWRLGLFSGLFNLISTTVSVYRGDTSLIDYIAAGALTGGMYKLNLGLAATFVGAGLGAVLATVFGSCILFLLKLTGVQMSEIRQVLTKFKEGRKEQFNEALKKASETANDPLVKHHEAVVTEMGEKPIQDI